jgi:hypothetical protein
MSLSPTAPDVGGMQPVAARLLARVRLSEPGVEGALLARGLRFDPSSVRSMASPHGLIASVPRPASNAGHSRFTTESA